MDFWEQDIITVNANNERMDFLIFVAIGYRFRIHFKLFVKNKKMPDMRAFLIYRYKEQFN